VFLHASSIFLSIAVLDQLSGNADGDFGGLVRGNRQTDVTNALN
jgi:hypothetical protein